MFEHVDLAKLLFGRLTWEAIPLHEPILLATFAAVVIGGLGLVAALTYFRVWGTLWRGRRTSGAHQKSRARCGVYSWGMGLPCSCAGVVLLPLCSGSAADAGRASR